MTTGFLQVQARPTPLQWVIGTQEPIQTVIGGEGEAGEVLGGEEGGDVIGAEG